MPLEIANACKMTIDPNKPFALYRLPGEASVHWVSGTESKLNEKSEIAHSQLFILNQFNQNFNQSLAFAINEHKKLNTNELELISWQSLPLFLTKPPTLKYTTKPQYLAQLEAMIGAIQGGAARKAILSRPIGVSMDTSQCLKWFQRLVWLYPRVMVCLMHFPGQTTWLTATPEVLLEVDDLPDGQAGKTLRTMSLAGTQADRGLKLDDITWGAKELEEQQIVTDYIQDVLKPYTKTLTTIGPETVSTGQVLHLRTRFIAELDDKNPLPLLLDALHPTPAVSGFPKEAALQLINNTEEYDRSYYAGYFGILGDDLPNQQAGKTLLFVNLRCMQIFQDEAVLYTGGGITADSIPEAEWMETEMKAQTLLRALSDEPLD